MEQSLKHDPEKKVFLNIQGLILKAQNEHELNIPSNEPYISDRGPDPIVLTYVYVSPNAAKNLAESSEGKDDNFRFMQDAQQQKKFTDHMIFIFHLIIYLMYTSMKLIMKSVCIC